MSVDEPVLDHRAEPGPAGVLLVDDHRESLSALKAVLEPLGEHLVAVESGEQALRELLQGRVRGDPARRQDGRTQRA